MKCEVLISTMNYSGSQLFDNMNLQCDAIVGNQTNYEEYEEIEYNGHTVKIISTTQRGLSNNRNQTLMRASGDICIIADDDVIYDKDYINIVENEFSRFSDADVLIFNIEDHAPELGRYINKGCGRVNYLNFMRYGSVRIAFKTQSIKKAGIFFNTTLGSGQKVSFGEDTVFLCDCLKKKLKVYYTDKYLLELSTSRESTWFKGYDEKYYYSKVEVFRQLSSRYFKLLCIQDAIRHYKMYKEKNPFACYMKMRKFFC